MQVSRSVSLPESLPVSLPESRPEPRPDALRTTAHRLMPELDRAHFTSEGAKWMSWGFGWKLNAVELQSDCSPTGRSSSLESKLKECRWSRSRVICFLQSSSSPLFNVWPLIIYGLNIYRPGTIVFTADSLVTCLASSVQTSSQSPLNILKKADLQHSGYLNCQHLPRWFTCTVLMQPNDPHKIHPHQTPDKNMLTVY